MTASINQVKAGTRVTVSGLTCIPDGTVRIVEEEDDELFIHCKEGKHFLDGQEEGDIYVGIHLVEE